MAYATQNGLSINQKQLGAKWTDPGARPRGSPSLQPTTGGFITLSSRGKKQHFCAGSWNWLECACVCVYLWCRGSKQPTVRNRRGLLVADTKPLLCNQLSVKSPLCGPHKAPQRQGAGGWGQSAATQLWAEPTHPSSIWALLISVATWPLLPPSPGTMEALGRPFCCKCFQSSFLAQILNISLGLLRSAPFLSLRF